MALLALSISSALLLILLALLPLAFKSRSAISSSIIIGFAISRQNYIFGTAGKEKKW